MFIHWVLSVYSVGFPVHIITVWFPFESEVMLCSMAHLGNYYELQEVTHSSVVVQFIDQMLQFQKLHEISVSDTVANLAA